MLKIYTLIYVCAYLENYLKFQNNFSKILI